MFAVIFLFGLLAIVVNWLWVKYDRRLPPLYPGSLPLIGHAHLLLGDGKYLWNRIQDVQRHCLENGGITCLKLGPQLHYIICDPDAYINVMNSCLEKNYWYQKILTTWVGEGLITASVPIWKRHQKLLFPSFGQHVIDGYMSIINKQARDLSDHLSSLVGPPFEPLDHITRYAMEANFQTVFSLEIDETTKIQKDTYIKAFLEIKQILTTRIQTIWMHSDLIYSFTDLKKRQDNAMRITRSLSDEVIATKRAAALLNKDQNMNKKEGRIRGFMDLILDLSDRGVFSDEEIRWEVDTTILSGYDTTASTTTHVCIVLGSYPEIQEKVYQELQEVFRGSDRDVNKQDMSQLVYLDAVIKEVGRLYPAAPVITRQVGRDIKLKNCTLPAGSSCAVLLSGVNRHKIWGADCDEFRPERWLDPTTLPEHASAYTGFSTGRRACVGKRYAVNYMKITLSHLLRKYRITSSHSKMILQLQIFLKPVDGSCITLEPRNKIC